MWAIEGSRRFHFSCSCSYLELGQANLWEENKICPLFLTGWAARRRIQLKATKSVLEKVEIQISTFTCLICICELKCALRLPSVFQEDFVGWGSQPHPSRTDGVDGESLWARNEGGLAAALVRMRHCEACSQPELLAACPADSENPGGAPERQQREKLAPDTKTMRLTIIKNNCFPASETTFPWEGLWCYFLELACRFFFCNWFI